MTKRRSKGFTLVELVLSLTLLALISALLYGSLMLAAESWDRGEAKGDQVRQMRLAEEFLRRTFTEARPLHLDANGESPFPFLGDGDWVIFPATLPVRRGGSIYYIKLSLEAASGNQLVLARIIPQYEGTTPQFTSAETTVLAEGVSTMKLQYFGSNFQNGPDEMVPSWRNHWDDRKQWPMLVRLDVTTAQGVAWPPLIVELKLGSQTVCDEIRRAHNMCNAP